MHKYAKVHNFVSSVCIDMLTISSLLFKRSKSIMNTFSYVYLRINEDIKIWTYLQISIDIFMHINIPIFIKINR
jgi:hypothetical protein